jgi:hypothetical protein
MWQTGPSYAFPLSPVKKIVGHATLMANFSVDSSI